MVDVSAMRTTSCKNQILKFIGAYNNVSVLCKALSDRNGAEAISYIRK
jgi:hypothetical protein